MVDESKYFHEGMSYEERKRAINDFVEACEEEGEQIPLWVRMEMDEEEIEPPSPELEEVYRQIDEKYGVG